MGDQGGCNRHFPNDERCKRVFQVLNNTPFQAAVSLTMDQFGSNLAVAAVKATFNIPENGAVSEIAAEQISICSGDEYFDRPDNSGVKYPSDLVPEKKNTDIGLVGCIYSPGGKPVTEMTASIRVGRHSKKLRVIGDRRWTKRFFSPGYRTTSPEFFVKMPMSCERLFGGTDTDRRGDHVSFQPNPHGTGFLVNRKHVAGTSLPNFEDPGTLISAWKQKPAPATFGFAGPAAEHRYKYSGTYDDKWKNYHAPLYPEDMDPRFFNSAQPELIADGFLKGGEPVQLKHVSKSEWIEFKLPEYRINMMFRLGGESVTKAAELYTIVFEPEEDRFSMTWGVSIPVGNQPSKMKYMKAEII